jgi:hypothetical protein
MTFDERSVAALVPSVEFVNGKIREAKSELDLWRQLLRVAERAERARGGPDGVAFQCSLRTTGK